MCDGIKSWEWTQNVKAYSRLACGVHPCKTAMLVVCQRMHSLWKTRGSACLPALITRGWPRAVFFPQGSALTPSKTEIEGSCGFIQEVRQRWMKVLSHLPVGLARSFSLTLDSDSLREDWRKVMFTCEQSKSADHSLGFSGYFIVRDWNLTIISEMIGKDHDSFYGK